MHPILMLANAEKTYKSIITVYMCMNMHRLTHSDPIYLVCTVVTVTQNDKGNVNSILPFFVTK